MENKANGLLIGALVCGIVGSVFAVLTGLCYTICGTLASAGTGNDNWAWISYVCGFGGGVVAIVGAAIAIKNGIAGGILMLISVLCSVVLIIVFLEWVPVHPIVIIDIILLSMGGILGIVGEIKRKGSAGGGAYMGGNPPSY